VTQVGCDGLTPTILMIIRRLRSHIFRTLEWVTHPFSDTGRGDPICLCPKVNNSLIPLPELAIRTIMPGKAPYRDPPPVVGEGGSRVRDRSEQN